VRNKVLLFIPTYNEAENVKIIYQLLKAVTLPEKFDILFLDDNSPDCTGDLIDQISKTDNTVFVIHRKKKFGIGSAHKKGIAWAYANNYHTLISMDCDLTHSPEYITSFYEAGKNKHIVIGSRYLDQNSLESWNIFRKALTNLGHFLTKHILNMPYDASGAFRLYQLNEIEKGILDLIESDSYSFFFESLFVLHVNDKNICEIPIKLPKRTYGNSKMSMNDAWTSFRFLFKLYIKKKFFKTALIYEQS